MTAWCRFTRVKFCLLIIIFVSHSLNAQLDKSSEKLRLKKLDAYSHLAATTIYNWNKTSNSILDWMLQNGMFLGQIIFGIFVISTFKENLKEITLKA